VHVHEKTTLTVIFHRFDPAPVGRMAKTGCCRSQVPRKVQQPLSVISLYLALHNPLGANDQVHKH